MSKLFDQLIDECGTRENLSEWSRAMVGLASFLASEGRSDEAASIADQLKDRVNSEGTQEDQRWCDRVDQAVVKYG